ncbi:MAG: transcriptional repressor [Candidatus Dormibacteraeota bacterium]|jgi:Fur family ferric uptake transcriptional regulator|nr:transcriptional repressor [Candidatus Dormibacteraeota bacterium]
MGRKPKIAGAVQELMAARGHHAWTLEELRQALAMKGVKTDFSSVFRATVRLEMEGTLRRVELDDGRTRLEIRDEHHDHFQCERCSEVLAVPCEASSAALRALEEGTGLVIRDHHMVLTGICRVCREVEGGLPTAAGQVGVNS